MPLWLNRCFMVSILRYGIGGGVAGVGQGGEGVDAGLARYSNCYLHFTRLRSIFRPIKAPAAAPMIVPVARSPLVSMA